MATAETRRKEEESRTQDGGVGSGSPARRESRSKRSTRQLDFFQAMSDFKSMFPTLDDEVIEAVLRANDGAVDATIDQLLTMTIDEDMSSVKGLECAAFNTPEVPKYHDDDNAVGGAASEDSPPSYSEAMRTPGPTDHAQSIWTTPIGSSKLPNRNQLKLEVDSHPEPLGAMARLSPAGLQSNTNTGLGFSSPTHDVGAFCVQRNSISDNLNSSSTRKKEYRNWNPPMLGNLPDDFLRLMLPDTNTGTPSAKTDSDKMTNLSASPVNVLSLTDAKPKIHKSRSKSEKVSRHSSIGGKDVKESKSKSSEKKGKSDKVQRSFSLVDGKSSGARHKEKHSGLSPSQSRKHGVIIETHDFSKGMLEERIKENERRRKKTSSEFDPELAQYLEDERLALALQNSEFLQELRSNDDFMKILQKEHINTKNVTNNSSSQTSSSQTSSPLPSQPTQTSTPLRPTDDLYEGYGNDSNKTLDAFPFSQPTAAKDEDAELRRQLSGMGKASKKQLASLARKFFRRKKKNSKQILGEKLAPSMMNLLEDDDDEDDDLHIDSRYGNSPTEIEPLPSTLIGVPSHRTSQRHHTTGFDNSPVDMV